MFKTSSGASSGATPALIFLFCYIISILFYCCSLVEKYDMLFPEVEYLTISANVNNSVLNHLQVNSVALSVFTDVKQLLICQVFVVKQTLHLNMALA